MRPSLSLPEYEVFVYSLQQQFPSIIRSTLLVARRSRYLVETKGSLFFAGDCRLVVYESLTLDNGPLQIENYSYEVWRGDEKLYWYDSQAHPNDPTLASTDPHHKHVPPDIKHHRIPAPDLSFDPPNLPFLIQEIEDINKSPIPAR
jgi:hypothetical protein